MDVKTLRERVEAASGNLQIGSAIAKLSDGDIDIYFNNELIAWVNSSKDGLDQVSEAISVSNSCIRHIDALGALAQFIGLEVAGIKPIQIIRDVVRTEPVDTSERDRLAGKVEAYEKLL